MLLKFIHLSDDTKEVIGVQSFVGFPLADINGDDFFRDEEHASVVPMK